MDNNGNELESESGASYSMKYAKEDDTQLEVSEESYNLMLDGNLDTESSQT
jgi:hypothetical protein